MPSWSAKGFFFLVIGFLLYTVAGGWASKWKAILTASASTTAANNAAASAAYSLPGETPLPAAGAVTPIAPVSTLDQSTAGSAGMTGLVGSDASPADSYGLSELTG